MKNAPCLNCSERAPACWDRCPRYKDFRAEIQRCAARERLEKDAETAAVKGILRMHKRDPRKRGKTV